MRTNTMLLCVGFLAACGTAGDGSDKGQNQQNARCFTCRNDGDVNKLTMAVQASDFYSGGYPGDTGRVVAIDEYAAETVYALIKRREFKYALCNTPSYPPQGVAYFDGPNAGSTMKFENCGDGYPNDDDVVEDGDWLYPKYDGSTLIHPGAKLYYSTYVNYYTGELSYGYLEFIARSSAGRTNYSWYQLFNHRGPSSTYNSAETLYCDTNATMAGWTMFVPGAIDISYGTAIYNSGTGEYTYPVNYVGYAKDIYNLETYQSWNYEGKLVSLSCANWPTTNCLLGSGVTQKTPALLTSASSLSTPSTLMSGEDAYSEDGTTSSGGFVDCAN